MRSDVDIIQAENDLLDFSVLDDDAITNSLEEVAQASVSKLIDDNVAQAARREEKRKERALRKPLSDEAGQDLVDSIFNSFPALALRESHWTLTLTAILNRVGFEEATGTKPVDLVKKGVTVGGAKQISEYVVDWVRANPDYESMEQPQPSHYSESTTYVAEHMASEENPEFGSW